MDFDLMITSLPKLLSAAVITLKLLSASLIIGLFIGFLFNLKIANKRPMAKPRIKDTDKSFKVTTAALNNLGKLVTIKLISTKTPYYT